MGNSGDISKYTRNLGDLTFILFPLLSRWNSIYGIIFTYIVSLVVFQVVGPGGKDGIRSLVYEIKRPTKFL